MKRKDLYVGQRLAWRRSKDWPFEEVYVVDTAPWEKDRLLRRHVRASGGSGVAVAMYAVSTAFVDGRRVELPEKVRPIVFRVVPANQLYNYEEAVASRDARHAKAPADRERAAVVLAARRARIDAIEEQFQVLTGRRVPLRTDLTFPGQVRVDLDVLEQAMAAAMNQKAGKV